MSSNPRKRNRWGGPQATERPNVSDDDAIRALLASAQSREEEKAQKKLAAAVGAGSEKQRGGSQQHRYQRDSDERKKPRHEAKNDDRNDFYGPPPHERQAKLKSEEKETGDEEEEPVEKQKPNFGLSGALAKDEKGGNVYKGVVLKFREPPEARAPKTFWRLYVYKGEEQIDTLHISKQSAYLLGRNEEIADIPLQHPSCSSQHAVIQYRALPNKEGKVNCQPYLLDLESTNGSFINGIRIDSARYYQLKKGDVLKFGSSTREYVLLSANTKST